MFSKVKLALFTTVFWTVIFISFSWQNVQTRINILQVFSVSNATETQYSSNSRQSIPLLTLFTTFKETPERTWIQMNTVLNWELLYPEVQPLLFTMNSSSPLAKAAREHHWLVLPVPKVNSYGTPFFKEMYFAASKHIKSQFYSYANADILFTETLPQTLRTVNQALPAKPTLVIGRRINIVKNYTDEPPFYKPAEVLDFAAKKGKLYRTDAEDYFAIGNVDNFPWIVIKDVVIGRPAYDNYVVGMACRHNVTVIDATYTIRAIHLSGGTKKFAGSNNKDGRYNFRVIGRFPWGAGMTTSVPFYTRKKPNGTIVIKNRRKRC